MTVRVHPHQTKSVPARLASGNGRSLLMFETNLPRVFAIGVIRSSSSKRVTSAADAGASAAAMVHEYQASLRHEQDAAGG